MYMSLLAAVLCVLYVGIVMGGGEGGGESTSAGIFHRGIYSIA